jgi:[ribosomal protein S5]-alanine N-acetyltransferase
MMKIEVSLLPVEVLSFPGPQMRWTEGTISFGHIQTEAARWTVMGDNSSMNLVTERLTLREWRNSDLDDLVEGLGNFAVAQWLAFVPHPYTPDHGASWLQSCITSAAKMPRRGYHLAIVLNSEAKVIGGVSLDGIDFQHGTAGGGIWLNAHHHNCGYGTEAFAARLRFAFDELNLRRIENGFLQGNEASRKLLEKLGYKLEGVKRKRFICMADGELKDEVMMALLREDWKDEHFAG